MLMIKPEYGNWKTIVENIFLKVGDKKCKIQIK